MAHVVSEVVFAGPLESHVEAARVLREVSTEGLEPLRVVCQGRSLSGAIAVMRVVFVFYGGSPSHSRCPTTVN